MNFTESSVLDEPNSLMTVRHVVLQGSNFDLGHALAKRYIERYGRPLVRFSADAPYAKARRIYFERNYPIHLERMRGVAAAFGVELDDDRYDLSGLPYHLDLPVQMPGCSVVYYPPSTTATGRGYLSRNYDFSTGTLADLMQVPLPPDAAAHLRPVMSEPYVMQWHPEDGGYASLAIQAFDMLSGTLDGMNSEGLAVSIMADEEAIAQLGPRMERHPNSPKATGLHELQVMRFLLDTCARAEEAEEALLTIKQYYFLVPCHYIVADRSGRSFIYENSTGRNVQHVIEGGGRPQIVTNFQVHQHPEAGSESPGQLSFENNALWRYRTLGARIAEHTGRFSLDDLKTNNACVNIQRLFEALDASPTSGHGVAAGVQARTLWHSLYDQQDKTAEFSFYMGETVNSDGARTERRSDYVRFAIEPRKQVALH